jgi:hypothetical protein
MTRVRMFTARRGGHVPRWVRTPPEDRPRRVRPLEPGRTERDPERAAAPSPAARAAGRPAARGSNSPRYAPLMVLGLWAGGCTFAGLAVQDPFWWLPHSVVRFTVAGCQYTVHNRFDDLTYLAGFLLAAGAVGARWRPRAAALLASASLTITGAAVSINGTSWFEDALTGAHPLPLDCQPPPPPVELGRLAERALYDRGQVLALAAVSVLAAVAFFSEDARAPAREWAGPQRWGRWLAAIALAGLGVVAVLLLPRAPVADLTALIGQEPEFPLGFLLSAGALGALFCYVPVRSVHRGGLVVTQACLGLAFGQYAFLRQTVYAHATATVPEVVGTRVSYVADVPDKQLQALALAQHHEFYLVVGFLVVWGTSLLVQRLVRPAARPADGAAGTRATNTGAADPGAADTGAADTGAAESGAADTAADTGAAGLGASSAS